jgi:hypothetical protein
MKVKIILSVCQSTEALKGGCRGGKITQNLNLFYRLKYVVRVILKHILHQEVQFSTTSWWEIKKDQRNGLKRKYKAATDYRNPPLQSVITSDGLNYDILTW